MDTTFFPSDSYICTRCNMRRERIRIVEEGIDTATGNPYGLMELNCGHVEKFLRVTNAFNVAPLFRKSPKLTLEPQIVDGTPSLSVSGGGLNLIGGSVKIDFKGITNDNIIMNISNININANTAVLDQNMLQHAITSDYDKIRLLVDSGKYSEIDRAGIISTLEEIKDELKLKQIPLSKLDKLKQYKDVYHMTVPWVMKVLDLIIKTGAFNM